MNDADFDQPGGNVASNDDTAKVKLGPRSLPPEMDMQLYRLLNPDLRHLSDAEAEAHYRKAGLLEGRKASAIFNRTTFVALLEKIPSILEIGPLATPMVRGNNVKYFDVLSTDGLRERARQHGLDEKLCPQIDFYSPTGNLSVVDRAFDAIVSSHAIEHQPDLVQHLAGVSKLLALNSRYYLVVPDKRYCFDHFIPESSIADVLDAHLRGAQLHSAGSVIEHVALTTHNDTARHWKGDHGDSAYRSTPERLTDAAMHYIQREGHYIDAHAWQFTPPSFRDVMQMLFILRLSSFEVERVYPTVRNSNEFYAVLKKTSEDVVPLRGGLPANFDAGEYLLANPDVAQACVDATQHYLTCGRREGRKLRP